METYNSFRVRKGWFGCCILQQRVSLPSFSNGRVDSSKRDFQWVDVNYDRAPSRFIVPFVEPNDGTQQPKAAEAAGE